MNTLDYPDWVKIGPQGILPPMGICVEFKIVGNDNMIIRGHTVSVTSFNLRNNGRSETMFVANNRQLFEASEVGAWRQIPDEPVS
jgi:hypothetical protein